VVRQSEVGEERKLETPGRETPAYLEVEKQEGEQGALTTLKRQGQLGNGCVFCYYTTTPESLSSVYTARAKLELP